MVQCDGAQQLREGDCVTSICALSHVSLGQAANPFVTPSLTPAAAPPPTRYAS